MSAASHSVAGLVDEPPPASQNLLLKQDNRTYVVQDWDMLRQWIREGRVDRKDLVSEGDDDWKVVGELEDVWEEAQSSMSHDNRDVPSVASLDQGAPLSDHVLGDLGWRDDDTEGVPIGLPSELSEVVGEGDPTSTVEDADVEEFEVEPAPPAFLETPEPSIESEVEVPKAVGGWDDVFVTDEVDPTEDPEITNRF